MNKAQRSSLAELLTISVDMLAEAQRKSADTGQTPTALARALLRKYSTQSALYRALIDAGLKGLVDERLSARLERLVTNWRSTVARLRATTPADLTIPVYRDAIRLLEGSPFVASAPQRPTYPLSLADQAPGPGFVRMALPLDIGRHTGHPFYHPGQPDEIWKALDALPFPNATVRCATDELAMLAFATQRHLPGFPPNWRWARANGRNWLVRPRAVTLQSDPPATFTLADVLSLEDGLRQFNALGYSLGDPVLEAAIDPHYGPFWLDLSCAGQLMSDASDATALQWWMRRVGFTGLADLRAAGQAFHGRLRPDIAAMKTAIRHYRHVYAGVFGAGFMAFMADEHWHHDYGTQHAPIASDRLPDGRQIDVWRCLRDRLSAADMTRYDLTWAWSPISDKESSDPTPEGGGLSNQA